MGLGLGLGRVACSGLGVLTAGTGPPGVCHEANAQSEEGEREDNLADELGTRELRAQLLEAWVQQLGRVAEGARPRR